MSLSRGMESLHRTPQRIKEEGLQLLDILKDYDTEQMSQWDREFYVSIAARLADRGEDKFFISEEQVTWLRDIKDRYL